jgi:putative transposase
MAHWAVESKAVSIRVACASFAISTTFYRYVRKLDVENAKIADSLIQLTETNRNWGFGLCFLHLRNVKKKRWNHKRVYRIYCDLELNLRIKPKKRLERETPAPAPLAVPAAKNETWSMDFMHDQLADGRSIRLFNVIESHRVSRRLQFLREWRHEEINSLFPRSP